MLQMPFFKRNKEPVLPATTETLNSLYSELEQLNAREEAYGVRSAELTARRQSDELPDQEYIIEIDSIAAALANIPTRRGELVRQIDDVSSRLAHHALESMAIPVEDSEL